MRTLAFSLLFVSFLVGTKALADENYYLVMFASQYGASVKDALIDLRDPNPPNHSHTFASFVKVSDGQVVDVQTISWLPADGVVSAGIRVVGKNFGLVETLNWALNDQENLYYWGPYPIQGELYGKAVVEANHLNSGAEFYKRIDFTARAYHVANCIHAAAEVVSPLLTGRAHGILASSRVLSERYSPYVLSWQPEPSVLSAIGIAQYPLHSMDR